MPFDSLGTYRKTRNPPPPTHAPFESQPSEAAAALVARLNRWHLQTVARKTLGISKGLNGCCRSLIRSDKMMPGVIPAVKILKSDKGFHYGGLMTCGSVWVCPICASKITEKRRLDLSAGVVNHTANGGGVLMLTLTVPHYFADKCQTVLDGLSDALRRLLNRGTWKGKPATAKKPFRPGWMQDYSLFGRVRTLEVTYGENGWHPHFHILLFTAKPLSNVEMFFAGMKLVNPDFPPKRGRVYDSPPKPGMWQSACIAAGICCPNEHGCQLVDGRALADYVSKWGSTHEMTKGLLKVGKKEGHYGPFALLQLIADGNNKTKGIFREYAAAFVGKRQLVWSDGLRALVGLSAVDATDEELAAAEEEKALLFANLPLNVWKCVLQADRRGELLRVCEQGMDALQDYIIDLMGDELHDQMLIDDLGGVRCE